MQGRHNVTFRFFLFYENKFACVQLMYIFSFWYLSFIPQNLYWFYVGFLYNFDNMILLSELPVESVSTGLIHNYNKES